MRRLCADLRFNPFPRFPLMLHSVPTAAKPFFIGIDSDGTVFDSMEIKHKRVFQPLAVEIWGLAPVEKEFHAIAESINLYSSLRGINRFEGLALAFERLAEASAEGCARVEGVRVLREFADSGRPLSFASLAEFNAEANDAFLARVLEWSRRSDTRYAEIMEREAQPPYPRVRDFLSKVADRAEVVVVRIRFSRAAGGGGRSELI